MVIPFDNTIGKDTALYKLYNTNIHEKIAEGLMDRVQDYTRNADDFGDNGDDTGIDTSLISRYISEHKSDMEPAKSENPKVEQSAGKYNSWLIY